MRQFLPALESVQDVRFLISLEEEMLLIDENARDEAMIEKDLGEVNRGLDVTDGLEDLAVVAGNVEAASAEETQLTEICGQMATAGTEVEPGELIASMERFRQGRIATEGFKETARQIWESIQKYLARVWESIVAFFRRIFMQIPRARHRLETLKQSLASIDRSGSRLKADAHVGAFGSEGYRPIKTAKEFLGANKAFTQMANWVFGDYARHVLVLGEKAVQGIEAFDPQQPQQAADKLRAELVSVKLAKMPGVTRVRKLGDREVECSDDLLHNKVVLVSDLKQEGKMSTLGVLERLRTHHVQITDAYGGRGAASVPVQCRPMTLDEMGELVRELEAQLKAVEKFDDAKHSGEFQRIRKDLERASKKAQSTLASLDREDGSGHHQVVETWYRAMLNFNPAFCSWINQPLLQMSSLTLTNIRHGVVRIQESLRCYEFESAANRQGSSSASAPEVQPA